jgi:hypothetical protein
VLLTLGLKYYLEKHAKECRFLSAEPIFHTDRGSEIKPDVVLRYEPDSGALCEIKTSFPYPNGYLLDSLKQLEKYGEPTIGWDTPDRKVNHHDVVLFCDILNINRVLPKIKEWLDISELKVKENLVICEWGIIESPKTGDTILIRKRFGDPRCKELNALFNEDMQIDLQTLTVAYEKCRFTRKEPPVEYTMEQIWMHILSQMTEKFETFETSIDEILNTAIEYYIPWSNISGEYSQIRKTWIRKAMDKFCEIEMAGQISNDPNKYKIFRDKPIKDFREYIIERICGRTEEAKLKARIEPDRAQKTISDFSHLDSLV